MPRVPYSSQIAPIPRRQEDSMKIVYDDIVYSLQKAGGISVVWAETTKQPPFHATHIRYDNADGNVFARKIEGHDYEIISSSGLIVKRYMNVRRHEAEPYLFHSSYFRYCLDPKAVNITTMHDFTFELFFRGPLFQVHIHQKKNTTMHSDGVICISENTKRDLLKYYPDYRGEIAVIYNGYDTQSYYYEPAKKEPIVLFVGSRTFYKRFDLAAKIVKELPDCKLVVVGGGAFTKQEQALLEAEIPGRYEKAGFLDNDALRRLYNRAFCLVYCSDYEGFGIPPLEAQACGCPVICQARSSLPEVVEDSAIYFDPDQERRSMDAVLKLRQPEFYNDIVRRGLDNVKRFSWTKCSREVYGFYDYMLDRKGLR